MAPRSELYAQVEPFARPRRSRAIATLLDSFVPYLVLTVLMVTVARRGHPWLALAGAPLAAGFLVRVFIIFHDCCHGSFFSSRRANRIVGYAAGLLTLTPFDKWQQAHAEHHATVGDLDRRGRGDVWTLTVREYLDASWFKRLSYRVFRNPFVAFGIGPAVVFLLQNRYCSPGARRRERLSVHFTNACLAAVLVAAYLTIGLEVLLVAQLSTLVLAATAGVWLFYVQHQYEDAYWTRRPDWDPLKAALQGSSYYKLPAVLQWFSGNIGLHHIHHLQPRVPSYNLARCQAAVTALHAVPPLTIRRSLHSLRLRLVDEANQRMVCAREIGRLRGGTEVLAARR